MLPRLVGGELVANWRRRRRVREGGRWDWRRERREGGGRGWVVIVMGIVKVVGVVVVVVVVKMGVARGEGAREGSLESYAAARVMLGKEVDP